MATAQAVTYSAASGATIYGGRTAGGVGGSVAIADLLASGSVVSQSSSLTGSISLTDLSASGSATGAPPSLTGSITLDDVVGSGGSALVWQFSDAATLNTGRYTTTVVATGVPADATYYSSPDLLPGQSLQLSGTTLSIVGDGTVPTVNGDSSGSVLDLASDRDVTITVLDAPMARARNLRYPLIWWGAGESSDFIYGMVNGRARLANVLNAEYGPYPCISGDTIEITPGAVAQTSDGFAFDGSGGYMHAACSVTIKNIDGAGRWRLLPEGSFGGTEIEGIVLHRPPACRFGERINVTIQGYVCDNLGNAASAISLRRDADVVGSYAPYVAGLTLKDFRFFSPSGRYPNSAVSGMAETMLLEDGVVVDFGNGSGQEHNLYISARTMTLRGIRSRRTRGWNGEPYGTGTTKQVEGHLTKMEAVTGLIEGCVFDGGPDLADHSLLLQMKAGGNWTVQGNLLIDSPWANNHNGMVNMCREMKADLSGPNYKWFAGSEGNSLTFRKNVVIGHMARPIIFFFQQDNLNAMRPATGGSWLDKERMGAFVCEDNIGMVASAMRNGLGQGYVRAGWAAQDAATKPLWIDYDPNAGPTWGARGNLIVPYDQSEAAFMERELLGYRRAAGPVAASGGTVSTRRFIYPHGSVARSDAYKGLG